MKLTDLAWMSWQKTSYASSASNYKCDDAYGTPAEPLSSLWCASLVAPLQLSEPFVIVDWGCGDGRLFNFLSERFKDFRYYGLERPGEFGANSIARARGFFSHDPRAVFDVYGGDTEACALKETSFVVMGSIATHLPIEQFAALLQRVMPALPRGGTLIASCFIEDTARLVDPAVYGHADCYGFVSYTRDQLENVCSKHKLCFDISDTFTAACGSFHQILKLTAAATV